MMILVVGLGFIACTPVSEGPGYVEPPVEPETPPEVKTYEVKFEVVETEYWLEDKTDGILDPIIIDESKLIDPAIEGIKSHKPSFETKTLEENEEYVLEDYNEWIFDTLKFEVQYFADEDLTSPIEPGSVIKNEDKTIYIKFAYCCYGKEYSKDFNEEYNK